MFVVSTNSMRYFQLDWTTPRFLGCFGWTAKLNAAFMMVKISMIVESFCCLLQNFKGRQRSDEMFVFASFDWSMVTRTSFVQIGHGADHQGTAVLFGGRFRQFTWVEACLARRTFPRPHFADARDALSPQRRSPSSTRSTTTCCKATRSSSWPTQSSTQWKKTTPANKAREWFPWTGRAKMPVSLRRALLWTTKRNSCVFMACSERRYALARHFSLCGSRFFRFEWPSFGDCMVPMPSDNAIYKKKLHRSGNTNRSKAPLWKKVIIINQLRALSEISVPSKRILHWANVFQCACNCATDVQPMKCFKLWKGYAIYKRLLNSECCKCARMKFHCANGLLLVLRTFEGTLSEILAQVLIRGWLLSFRNETFRAPATSGISQTSCDRKSPVLIIILLVCFFRRAFASAFPSRGSCSEGAESTSWW